LTDWHYVNVERLRQGDTAIVKWNPGKKIHEVIVDGKVVFGSENKEEADKYAEGKMAA